MSHVYILTCIVAYSLNQNVLLFYSNTKSAFSENQSSFEKFKQQLFWHNFLTLAIGIYVIFFMQIYFYFPMNGTNLNQNSPLCIVCLMLV